MQIVVSFSGGRTSAYLCYLMKAVYGEFVDIVFMDTGVEHPATYEFVKKCNDYFNLNLTCLRLVINPVLGKANTYEVIDINDCKFDMRPWKDMLSKYGVPYIGGMFCTDRLKLVPHDKYCDDTYGKGNYQTWLGMRADEPSRMKLDNDKNIRYLGEISRATKEDILDFWEDQPFDLTIPEWLGNCVFCPKKSDLKLAAAQRDEPELYFQWLDSLHSPDVRIDDSTGHRSRMYRRSMSLENMIAQFDGATGYEIKQRLRGSAGREVKNSCSESCELYNL